MSNLLDRASILLTPTAVSNETLHSVKPVQTFSDELITNGSFDADTNWTKFSNATISGGTANLPNASAAVRQTGILELNTKYKITYDVISSNSNNALFTTRGGTSLTIDLPSSVGSHTVFGRTGSSGGAEFFISVKPFSASIVIDNVSVKKVTDGDFDFTRATTATRVNSSSLIESVAAGLPRIDFLSGTGQFLLEPSSTNLFTNSQDFDTFGKGGGITVSNSTELAPTGLNEAQLIQYSGSSHAFFRVGFSSIGTETTSSIFAKKGNWRYFGLRLFENSGSPVNHTVFDFDTNAFVQVTSGYIASFDVLPNGWYRLKVTNLSTDRTISHFCGFSITDASGVENNPTFGQAANVHVFGAQLEEKSFATSYIPTSGSIVTRNADLANNSGNPSLIDTTQGVLYTETACLVDGDNNRAISIGSDGQNVASIQYNPTSNRILGRYRNAGNFECQVQFDVADRTQFSKIAFRYKQDDFVLFVNGVKVGIDDTSGNVLSANTFTSLALNSGMSGVGQPFEGKVKCVAVFKEFLNNDELECLTGSGFDSFTALAEAGSYTII